MEAENSVVKLNEYAQRTRSQLRYEDVGSVGPDHIKTFSVRVVLNDKVYPDGTGKNKKEAKQNAAKNALRSLLDAAANCTENEPEASTATPPLAGILKYMCWLNEYCQKHRLSIRPVELTQLGPNNAPQCCSFVIGDKEYPAGYGKTKKEAKEEAARLVYNEICGSKSTETGDDIVGGTLSNQKQELNDSVSEICDKMKFINVKTEGGEYTGPNIISMVNHYCQRTKCSHDYILERKCGPPHNPQFFYKLVIDSKEYPVAEGKNVKEAKQKAAELAWTALQEQSDWDSKVNYQSVSDVDDGSPARPTKLPHTLMTPNTSDSAIFTSPSKLFSNKAQSPDVKSKIKLAANFQNSLSQSKEDVVNFQSKNAGNNLDEKKTTQSVQSRFTSEYDSIECLGKGTFGCVFKAKQKLVHQYYAIKIVRKTEKALREVEALSTLLHPNIVRYYTCWQEDSAYQWDSTADSSSNSQPTSNSSTKFLYIKMELCDNKTLRLWLDEKNTQNMKKSLQNSKRREESLGIAQQIICGVEHIHSKMLIHRDLKPANIMFYQQEVVKIGDFGLVTAENYNDTKSLIERTVYKGTPSYMAPEQKNRKTYDRKVDIFALGLIYFELLWNLSGDKKEIWDNARNQRLPQGFYKNFPQESEIIKSMLCEKPEDRPEATKVKTDLEEYIHKNEQLKTMCCDRRTV
ncbi:interferon-induced, double-stranded RNA-activated protein kinase [Echeneis naucrates]|uniref:interferon-induced, double-stranded RNA-activated protein kinase n=1 Tax=Echeneis naucrates TaxID=173247 RepID=UPI0011140D93|nr:interferon-induced, double-stranded RNA-activated protein kinase-like [Echeneis naucrates]